MALGGDYLTVAEAARRKHVMPRAIQRAIAEGRLVAVKVGSRCLILRSDLAKYHPLPPTR